MRLPEISFGFWTIILILAWYQWDLCLAFLAAVLVHELGHLAALRCCRIPVLRLRITINGAIISTTVLEPKEELVCALAGPLGSGVLAVAVLRLWPICSMVSLALAAVNLLPLLPLDGGRILRAGLEMTVSPKAVLWIMRISGFVVAGALMLCACWTAVWLQAGLWPIFAALVLLWRTGDLEK